MLILLWVFVMILIGCLVIGILWNAFLIFMVYLPIGIVTTIVGVTAIVMIFEIIQIHRIIRRWVERRKYGKQFGSRTYNGMPRSYRYYTRR
jgi:hypothetical protein